MRARSLLVLLLVFSGLLGWGPRVLIEVCLDPGACERGAVEVGAHSDHCCAAGSPEPERSEPELCGCCIAVPTGLLCQFEAPDDAPRALAPASDAIALVPSPRDGPAVGPVARPQLSHPPPQRGLPLLS